MPLPGFVPPCLPTVPKHPPSGGLWLHEIRHDGFSERPAVSALQPERGNDFPGFSRLLPGRHKPRHRNSVLGNDHALAGCHVVQQPGQVGLGLVRAYRFHRCRLVCN